MASDFLTELFAQAAKELLLSRLVKEVVVKNPAAGADWSQAVPGGILWEVLGIAGTFTSSGAAVARTVVVNLTDSDNLRVASANSTTAQGAGIAGLYTFSPGITTAYTSAANAVTLPLPLKLALPSWKIGTATQNIDVADQWSAIVLTVREWDETGIMQEIAEMDELFESYVSPRLSR